MRDHDVIVVGAGPAGATLSRELAAHGMSVLVLDRAVFPRYKCCGGGLTLRAATLLGDDIGELVENSISSAMLSFAGTGSFRGDYDQMVMYTLSREKFDHSLVLKAEEAGARVLQGTRANDLVVGEKDVEVVTSVGSFRSQFVVGADGAGSVVARSLHLTDREHVTAIETEVLVGETDMSKWRSSVMVDFGSTRDGYGWLFPKADHLSIGIASLKTKATDLKRSYWRFVNSLNLGRYDVRRWSGGIIPICAGTPVVSRGRVALVGDAAGLADPLTGEGIYSAILSAKLAGQAIEDALRNGASDLHAYQQAVEEVILPEMKAARFFSRLPRLAPKRLLDFANLDSRMWRAGCALLRGETTYAAIKDRVGTLGGLCSLLRQR